MNGSEGPSPSRLPRSGAPDPSFAAQSFAKTHLHAAILLVPVVAHPRWFGSSGLTSVLEQVRDDGGPRGLGDEECWNPRLAG